MSILSGEEPPAAVPLPSRKEGFCYLCTAGMLRGACPWGAYLLSGTGHQALKWC